MDLVRLLIEMVVVGIGLMIVSIVVAKLMGEKNVLSSPHAKDMLLGVFFSGALFHLLFEITGLNKWYADNYKPLL